MFAGEQSFEFGVESFGVEAAVTLSEVFIDLQISTNNFPLNSSVAFFQYRVDKTSV